MPAERSKEKARSKSDLIMCIMIKQRENSVSHCLFGMSVECVYNIVRSKHVTCKFLFSSLNKLRQQAGRL